MAVTINAVGKRAESGPPEVVEGALQIPHGGRFRETVKLNYVNRKTHPNAKGPYFVYKLLDVDVDTEDTSVANDRVTDEGGSITFDLLGRGEDHTIEVVVSAMAGFVPNTRADGEEGEPVGGELWKHKLEIAANTGAAAPNWPKVRTLWDTERYVFVSPNQDLNLVIQDAVFGHKDLGLPGSTPSVKFLDGQTTRVVDEVKWQSVTPLNDGSGVTLSGLTGMKANRGYSLKVQFGGDRVSHIWRLTTKDSTKLILPNQAFVD